MDAFLWMFLPVFVAGGSALLSFYIMQARMEVALSKERETLAEARATINSQRITMDERIKATEESTKRIAMDEFMQDFRVEERSYMRDSKSLTSSKRSMVMQERLFFRNIPLSNWIEREMVVEEGLDLDQLPKESVFQMATLTSTTTTNSERLPISKFINDKFMNEMTPSPMMSGKPQIVPTPQKSPVHANVEPVTVIATRIPAFGAQ